MIYSVKVEKRKRKNGDAQEVVQPEPLLVGLVGPTQPVASTGSHLLYLSPPTQQGKVSARRMTVVILGQPIGSRAWIVENNTDTFIGVPGFSDRPGPERFTPASAHTTHAARVDHPLPSHWDTSVKHMR